MAKKEVVTQEPVEDAVVSFKAGAEWAAEEAKAPETVAQGELFTPEEAPVPATPETVVSEGTEDPNKSKQKAPVKKEVLPDGTIVEHF